MMYEGYGPFNTREIASGFWLLVLFAWVIYKKPEVWGNIADATKAFTHPKILASVFTIALYTSGAVWLLAALNLWTPSLLKDTVFWFGATALVLMFRFAPSPNTDTLFKDVLLETLTAVIVLEFLLNTYTFSLPVEFILVPFLTVLAGFIVVADSDETSAKAAGCLKALQALIGTAILAVALVRALTHLDALGTVQALRTFALPPLLSLLFLPCLYFVVLATKYDSIFSRLKCGPEKSSQLMRYARRRIPLVVRGSIGMAQRLLSEHAWDLQQATSEEDIDRLLDEDADG
jgi:hypothetical protein